MHIPLHSAYTCFFLILSLFPGLLLLLGVLRYTALATSLPAYLYYSAEIR